MKFQFQFQFLPILAIVVDLLPGLEPEMPLGARVLVLKGETWNDAGKMVATSRVAGSQAEISYRGPTGAVQTRRKSRSSLIRSDDGVELSANADGWSVVRPIVQSNEVNGINDVARTAISEDESRAQ